MRFGVVLPKAGQKNAADALREFAVAAEDLGLHSVWCGDHIIQTTEETYQYPYSSDGSMPRARGVPFTEMMVTLTYVAAITNRVRVGSSVSPLPYRDPIVQAKMWATLDVLSGGRVICGFGVGYLEKEFSVLGVPFEPRGAMTDEYLRALRVLWTEKRPTFAGRFTSFDGIYLEPKPVQDPLPIWIGGNSYSAIRRAATWGQGWHIARLTPDEALALIPRLRSAAERAGRDPEQITISLKRRLRITDIPGSDGPDLNTGKGLVGTTPEIVADLRRCQEVGIQEVVFDFYTGDLGQQLRILERLASDVIPAVAA